MLLFTTLFLVLCIVVAFYVLIFEPGTPGPPETFVTNINQLKQNMELCLTFPPSKKATNTSCLDYVVSCKNKWFNDEVIKNKSKSEYRLATLNEMVMAMDSKGKNLQSCKLPYDMLKKYEMDENDCPEGSKFDAFNKSCVVKIGQKNSQRTGLRIVKSDATMDFIDNIRERYFEGMKNPDITVGNTPQMTPDKTIFPELNKQITEYENYYNSKTAAFREQKIRWGYIVGLEYSMDNPQGKLGNINVIQKKFGDRYYSLAYKYTTAAYKSAIESPNLPSWFTEHMNWEKPKVRGEAMGDLTSTYKTPDDFIASDVTYRAEFILRTLEKTKGRVSVIIEVFNSKNPGNPLISLEFMRHGRDENNIYKFFSRLRLVNSEFTSNKRLIEDQMNCRVFSINAGPSGSWHIGYTTPDQCGDNFVYMTIPTGQNCPWHGWFKGNIVVSNSDPVILGGNIADFESFKKNNVGDLMLVWMCADNNDPLQNIQISKDSLNFNPFLFKSIFIRKPGATDEEWAMYIYKTITNDGMKLDIEQTPAPKIEIKLDAPPAGGPLVPAPVFNFPPAIKLPSDTAYMSKEYKMLVERVKGKNVLDFDDFLMVCNTAMKDSVRAKTAKEVGCIAL
uniref:Uncharacterized protein n=1 Tax=viral metagenome TaxID=1070528 RepID=A0A6C0BHI2_9ZZZZ